MKVIEINDLHFSYDDINVLKGLSFDVEHLDSVGIIGANGTGKTTLFHLVCGILKPDSGGISILERPVKYEEFNPLIGYVFQNPDDQLFSLTVLEDLIFGPLNTGKTKKEAEEIALNILEEMHLTHLKDRPSHHLSLGEKRMVSIASVLTLNPEIIIFDEPTSNLDSRSRRELIDHVNNLHKTKITSSHDFEFILETCPKGAILLNGKIAASGSTKGLFSHQKLMKKCNFEIPWSLRLKISK